MGEVRKMVLVQFGATFWSTIDIRQTAKCAYPLPQRLHRKYREPISLFDCGRRTGVESGGFLQEGLKDGEGWKEGKERSGKFAVFVLGGLPPLPLPQPFPRG